MKPIITIIFLLYFATVCKSQQNTILIIADDLGTDYFGFYPDGNDTVYAPNLRTLAQNGIVFTKAWAHPVCSPTRASMFTGRYPFRTGVGQIITTDNAGQLDTTNMGIAKLLRNCAPVNYNTACVGKWHMTADVAYKYLYPNKMGFDLYAGNLSKALPNYYSYVRVKNGTPDTVNIYSTTQTVNDAIDWLDTADNNKPFFLWLAFNAPHNPYHKPPDSLITDTTLAGTATDIDQHPVQYFKAALEAMDKEIGRLFQYLINNNMMDSTNIIFIGDNGNSNSTAQIANHAKAKGSLYDYGVHVPYIIKGPAVINPGRSSDALVNTTDLYATIAELSGFYNWLDSVPSEKLPVDSRSLLPIIKNQSALIRDWNFAEQFGKPAQSKFGKTIRNNNYHLLRFDDGNEELYNISIDTFELNNLLTGTLSYTDMINYYSLCDTLSNLIGKPHYCSMPVCTASVSINTSSTTICNGTTLTFTPTPINGGSIPVYNWYLNGNFVSTGNTYSNSTLTNGDAVSCTMISNDSCALYFKTMSDTIVITVIQPVNPSIQISASSNSICAGTSVELTAMPVNGGASASYQWKKNGINVGVNSEYYADSTLANNDTIICMLTSSAICTTDSNVNSNPVLIHVEEYITPSVTINASQNSICNGSAISFTANAINGGSSPGYQWKLNGSNVGSNTNFYEDSLLSNNDVITCELISNAVCVTQSTSISNSITMNDSASVTPLIAITTDSTLVCETNTVVFYASTINGGNSPTFQWKKNGINAGTNSNVYVCSSIANGDVVTCELLSNATCLTTTQAFSDPITITAEPGVTPSVSILSSDTLVCSGTNVTFTATGNFTGTSPVYQWKKNGNNVGTNSSTFSDSQLTGIDIISCELKSNAECASPSTVNSNAITITVEQTVTPLVSVSASATAICQGDCVTFTTQSVNGGSSPSYQWYKNGIPTGIDSASYTDCSIADGDEIGCTMVSNMLCLSTPEAYAAPVIMNVNPIVTPSITIAASATSICSGTNVTFTANANNTGIAPVYYWKKNGVHVGTNVNYFTDSTLTNNDEINCELISNAMCLSTPTVNSNTLIITVDSIVTPFISITASAMSVCTGTNVIFAASAINGGASPAYQWKKNGVIVGTNSNIYTSNSLKTGNAITCTLMSNLNCLTSTTANSNAISMIVKSAIPTTPSAISGETNNLCNTSSDYVYTVSPITSAVSYQWTVPLYATIKNGQGTNSIIVSYSSQFVSGAISVVAINGCGTSAARTMYVYAKPLKPGTISGPAAVCAHQQNVSYSIELVAGASSYKWSVPPGASIQSGKNTNAIVLNFSANSGQVTVLAKNSCANSAKSILPVSINCRTDLKNQPNEEENELMVANPFNNELVLHSSAALNNANLRLYDITGRELLQIHNLTMKSNETQSIAIDRELPAGIYFLNMITSTQNLNIKLVHD